jgi:putative transposase
LDQSKKEWEVLKHKKVFKFVDLMLDHKPAARHLVDNRLADIVQNSILHFAETRYHLFAFVVMPSHYHWLFLPNTQWSDEFYSNQSGKPVRRSAWKAISHSIQSYSGNQCNRLLGRSGAFWQRETFDHYARDDAELMRIIEYIEQNPVVAGIVSDASEYRWSSAKLRKQFGLNPGDPIAFDSAR